MKLCVSWGFGNNQASLPSRRKEELSLRRRRQIRALLAASTRKRYFRASTFM